MMARRRAAAFKYCYKGTEIISLQNKLDDSHKTLRRPNVHVRCLL